MNNLQGRVAMTPRTGVSTNNTETSGVEQGTTYGETDSFFLRML